MEITHILQHSNIGTLRYPSFGLGASYQPIDFSGIVEFEDGDKPNAGNYLQVAAQIYKTAQQGKAAGKAIIGNTREEQLDNVGKRGATSAVIYSVGAGAAAYTWGISSLLTLVPAEVYEKTLGQWFSDGFKCWGASETPTTAQQKFEIEANFIKGRAIQLVQSFDGKSFLDIEKAINDFWVFFYNVRSGERNWLDPKTSPVAKHCTRDGLILMVKALDNLVKEIEPKLIETIALTGHALVSRGTKEVTYRKSYKGPAHEPYKIKVPQYRIRINPAALNTAKKPLGNPSPNRSEAGFSTLAIWGMAALAAGTLIYKSI